jgi:hypothetical protein
MRNILSVAAGIQPELAAPVVFSFASCSGWKPAATDHQVL